MRLIPGGFNSIDDIRIGNTVRLIDEDKLKYIPRLRGVELIVMEKIDEYVYVRYKGEGFDFYWWRLGSVMDEITGNVKVIGEL